MATGTAAAPVVILVNGPSSCGKSTLCRALQDRLIDLADGDAAATFGFVAFDDKSEGRHGGGSDGLDYDVTVRTDQQSTAESVESILAALRGAGYLPR